MHTNHNRIITINKQDLIKKILANKENHIKDYDEAVEAYKIEAKKQLDRIAAELISGSLTVKLNLITPVNRAEEYDKVVEMFKWEVKEEIEITQREFNEYVHDETSEAKNAKFLNSSYK